MKIAVCFFGHLRTFKRCAPYIKRNLLNHYDCDLFMHTWSEYNHNTKTWHNNKSIKGTVNKEKILSVYEDIKDIIIEKQIVEDMGNITITSDNKIMSLFGIKSMYHSMQISYNLCEQYAKNNNIEYDFILLIRPDIVLSDNFNIERYSSILSVDELTKAFFTISNNSASIQGAYKFLRATDLLFFAKPNIIGNILNNSYNIIQKLSNNKVINHSPEVEFCNLINRLGYNIYLIKYSGWDVVRPIAPKDWIKQIIRIRIRKNYIKIHLFRYFLINIFSVRINLLNFEIDCCIGKSYSE